MDTIGDRFSSILGTEQPERKKRSRGGITLTPEQQEAVKSAKWLLDPKSRSTGRSTVLAVAAIETARENPGYGIPIISHWANSRSSKEIEIRTVRTLLSLEKDKEKFELMNSGHLVYRSYSDELTCKVTGNPCGTDTWSVGYPCTCSSCQEYLAGL